MNLGLRISEFVLGAVAWFKVGRKPEMPDKMHLEGGPKISPPLAESEEESFSPSEHVSGFPEPQLVPVTQGPAALIRKPAGSCCGIGGGSCYSTVPDNRFLLLPILHRMKPYIWWGVGSGFGLSGVFVGCSGWVCLGAKVLRNK